MTLLGAIGFSSKAILVKIIYRVAVIDTISLLALRMLFSLPFFLFLAFNAGGKKNRERLGRNYWWRVILAGIMGYYVSSFLDFRGLKFISAGLERLILFTYPTIVVLLGVIIKKNKVYPFQLLALFLSYAGMAFAFMADIRSGNNANALLGGLLIFACACTYAIYVFTSGQLVTKTGAIKFTSVAMLGATAAILGHYLLQNNFGFHLLNYPPPVYGYAFLMATATTVLPAIFISEGIRRIGSSNVAIISSIGPLATILQASWFLGEAFGWQQGIGTALVIFGVILLGKNIGQGKKKEPEEVLPTTA